jgi:hypothetical protein
MGRKKEEATPENRSYNPLEDQPRSLMELCQWVGQRKKSAGFSVDQSPPPLDEARPGLSKVLAECRHRNGGVVSLEGLQKMGREYAKASQLAYLEAMAMDLEEVGAKL